MTGTVSYPFVNNHVWWRKVLLLPILICMYRTTPFYVLKASPTKWVRMLLHLLWAKWSWYPSFSFFFHEGENMLNLSTDSVKLQFDNIQVILCWRMKRYQDSNTRALCFALIDIRWYHLLPTQLEFECMVNHLVLLVLISTLTWNQK